MAPALPREGSALISTQRAPLCPAVLEVHREGLQRCRERCLAACASPWAVKVPPIVPWQDGMQEAEQSMQEDGLQGGSVVLLLPAEQHGAG